MFNADGFTGAVGAVVGVCSDVTNGIDVGFAKDLETLVDAKGAVMFKRNCRVVFEVRGFWGDTNAKDDEIGRERGAVLEFD